MQAFIARQFAKSKAIPNTFIGGIAKTGGTGVNAPIDTPYKLSQKLGIAVNRITGFKVIGDDVECRIRGSYEIPQNAFGAASSANANKNITSFFDEDGLVSMVGINAFRHTTLNSFKLNSADVRSYAFANTLIETASLPALLTNTGNPLNFDRQFFANCGLLKTVNIPNFTGYMLDWFLNTPLLETVNHSAYGLGYTAAFQNSGILNFYSDTILYINTNTINGAGAHFTVSCKAEVIELPNLLQIGNTDAIFGVTYQKQFIATKLISIGSERTVDVGGAFSRPSGVGTNVELIDIRACKTMGTNVFLRGLKTNDCVIKVHEFMATSNGGNADPNLTYAKEVRGATVEFYDDNGDYVSTL